MSSSDVAVSVRGLSKKYVIAHNAEKHSTVAEALMHRLKRPFARPETEAFWALKDVEFDIQKGDVVGIIGRNGAGKSTLLKILSRITEPTTGTIDLYGRVGSLLEVGTGFHPELTGRENIFLNGAILGMSKREIAGHMDAIVDFAEISQFLDTPVKRYSSGMYIRLAFAVAAHFSSDILIVDEVLAVGDAAFQKKCLGKMQDVSQGGRTVLFVSHNAAAVSALCTRCLFLRAGRVENFGPTSRILQEYLCSQQSASGISLRERSDRAGTGKVRCIGIGFFDSQRRPISTIPPTRPFTIDVEYESDYSLKEISVSIDVETIEGMRVTTLYSGFHNQTFRIPQGSGVLRCHFDNLPLRPDNYVLNVMIGTDHEQHDFVRSAASLDIQESFYTSGRVPGKEYGPYIASFQWTLEEHSLLPVSVA